VDIVSEGFDEFLNGFQAASEGSGDPPFEESRGGPWGLILPELFKFILQYPGPMDPPVAFLERVEDAGVLLGAVRRMPEQEPSKSLEGLTVIL